MRADEQSLLRVSSCVHSEVLTLRQCEWLASPPGSTSVIIMSPTLTPTAVFSHPHEACACSDWLWRFGFGSCSGVRAFPGVSNGSGSVGNRKSCMDGRCATGIAANSLAVTWCVTRSLFLLKEIEASQHFHQGRLDAFSIENHVIKKGRPRGARHGKTEAQKEHFIAHNARRRCLKKKFEGIHDRFLKDSTYRDSQLKMAGLKRRALQCTN